MYNLLLHKSDILPILEWPGECPVNVRTKINVCRANAFCKVTRCQNYHYLFLL